MRGSNPLVTSSDNDIDEEEGLGEEKFYSHLNITVSHQSQYYRVFDCVKIYSVIRLWYAYNALMF